MNVAPPPSFQIGETVFHGTFGEGIVESPSLSGKGLNVWFASSGETKAILPGALFCDAASAKAFRGLAVARNHRVDALPLVSTTATAIAKAIRGKLVDLGEDRPFVPRSELVRDTLPRTGVAFIGGQSGALKSFFCIHAAVCIGTGEALAGRKIERVGGVVYVAAEGEGTIEGRIKARRSLLPTATTRLPFIVLTDMGPISGPEAYAALEVRLREAAGIFEKQYGLPLVGFIVDTVAAAGMIPEDRENDQGAWQKVFDSLKPISTRLDALAILVHHAGKTASAGLRGSSNIRGGADAVLMLSCDRDEITGEAKNHFLALSKSRDAPEGPIGQIHHRPVVIGQREDGSEVTSLVLEIDTGTKVHNVAMVKSSRASKAFKEAFLEALASDGERQRVHGDGSAPEVMAVRMGHVRDTFARFYVTGGDDDRKRKELLRKQFKAGLEQAIAVRLVISGSWHETEWLWQAGNLAGTFAVEDDE